MKILNKVIKTITKETLKKFIINFPSISEQKNISEIITAFEKNIHNLKTKISKLKELKTSSINALTKLGINNKLFKHSEFGNIPQHWNVMTFQNIFKNYTYGPRFNSNN